MKPGIDRGPIKKNKISIFALSVPHQSLGSDSDPICIFMTAITGTPAVLTHTGYSR